MYFDVVNRFYFSLECTLFFRSGLGFEDFFRFKHDRYLSGIDNCWSNCGVLTVNDSQRCC